MIQGLGFRDNSQFGVESLGTVQGFGVRVWRQFRV